jgi:hypothetical protein
MYESFQHQRYLFYLCNITPQMHDRINGGGPGILQPRLKHEPHYTVRAITFGAWWGEVVDYHLDKTQIGDNNMSCVEDRSNKPAGEQLLIALALHFSVEQKRRVISITFFHVMNQFFHVMNQCTFHTTTFRFSRSLCNVAL